MESLGLVEISGLSLALVALDALDKSARVQVIEVELNDQLGALIKFAGDAGAVRAAAQAAEAIVRQMRGKAVVDLINAPAPQTVAAAVVGREFNSMMGSKVVFSSAARRSTPAGAKQENAVNGSFAIGLIETQGLTAVLEALDTACKAANVEVVGREKLGGGYVTVIIKGDVAAVKAAVEAGKAKVEGLGKLIAAHVIARPSEAVLGILPKS